MQFSKPSLPTADTALAYLATTDRAAVAIGRVSVLLAFLGLFASGFYLQFFDSGQTFLSFGALRGLHWLFGLVLSIAVIYRVVRLAAKGPRFLAGLRRRSGAPEKKPPWTDGAFLSAVAFWAVLAIVLVSGVESALHARYGTSVLPGHLPLPWIKVHSIATYYLLAVVVLRVFLWSRSFLRLVLPYLRRP
jgi:hypothetical protein